MAEEESQHNPKLEIERDAPKENTDLGEDNFAGGSYDCTLWDPHPCVIPLFVGGWAGPSDLFFNKLTVAHILGC